VAAADEQEPGLVDTIVGAVEGLPATERAVVTRRLLEDRPFAEIAVELQTTEAACRTRFSRAMRTVRAVLLGAGFVPP
jgi:DNA-directed RNA polymerase specialized sigma24 family protein